MTPFHHFDHRQADEVGDLPDPIEMEPTPAAGDEPDLEFWALIEGSDTQTQTQDSP